jgi:D-arabinose 1-dehydrogenase-like Zn-dependent alcohol dehydrogenase
MKGNDKAVKSVAIIGAGAAGKCAIDIWRSELCDVMMLIRGCD